MDVGCAKCYWINGFLVVFSVAFMLTNVTLGEEIFFTDGFGSVHIYTPCGSSGNYSKVGYQVAFEADATTQTPTKTDL